ncbi:hypothetical protein K488DRAFT_90473 [Vararia minispora EC-137]|uniref:Uncharacterized protein n=1 Tax=Vararia minispora EC-137 TaxID=1314806 RepID=A0ACB8Q7M6_9AGAM|nr:hypothetical protein K488DRAFT_90473 [Vararia minispora EC-137]
MANVPHAALGPAGAPDLLMALGLSAEQYSAIMGTIVGEFDGAAQSSADFPHKIRMFPFLHRLVIGPVGKTLDKYDTELEFLKGFKMSLEAHKRLCDMGILRRDISPGDLFLSDDPEVPGFIADVESAIISGDLFSGQDAFETRTRTVDEAVVERRPCDNYLSPSAANLQSERVEVTNTQRRGAVMTGTLQFMAREVLEALRDNDSIQRTPEHDVEALINVFCHSLLYRLCRRTHPYSHERPFFETSFANAFKFAGPLVSRMLEERMWASALIWIESHLALKLPPEIMSEPLKGLVSSFCKLYLLGMTSQNCPLHKKRGGPAKDQSGGQSPDDRINHKNVLKAIDEAIEELEICSALDASRLSKNGWSEDRCHLPSFL